MVLTLTLTHPIPKPHDSPNPDPDSDPNRHVGFARSAKLMGQNPVKKKISEKSGQNQNQVKIKIGKTQ